MTINAAHLPSHNVYFGHAVDSFEQAIKENKKGYKADIKSHVFGSTLDYTKEILEIGTFESNPLFVIHHSTSKIANYGKEKADETDRLIYENPDKEDTYPKVRIAIRPDDIIQSWVYQMDETAEQANLVQTIS
jgi:hypothetical protein